MIFVGLVGSFILGLAAGLYICIQTEVNKIVKQSAREATDGYFRRAKRKELEGVTKHAESATNESTEPSSPGI